GNSTLSAQWKPQPHIRRHHLTKLDENEDDIVSADAPLRPPLNAAALRDGLVGPGMPWRQLDVVAESGSTNADLITRSEGGVNIDGLVLLAEHQNAGRGRHGRQWLAPPHAQIALSVGVDGTSVPQSSWGWLPLATGVAVAD